MLQIDRSAGAKRRQFKAKQNQQAGSSMIERMEDRRLLSAAIAPLGMAAGVLTAPDLGTFQRKTSHTVKGAVGAVSTDVYYKVEVGAEINLAMTLKNLKQKDQVHLLFADGTLVNAGWSNSKPTLIISQHLNAGTYYIDIQHGFVAQNTQESGAGVKVKVKPVRRYRLKKTDGYVLTLKGLKHDDSNVPIETVKPSGFAAAFGATGAVAEPTISDALVHSSGFDHYQAFTAAQGYVLWGAGGPVPNDEIQQYIGDCYFMSIISSIARNDPGLIEKDIVPQANGDYVVKFQSNGHEVDEQVDNQFPVNAAGNTVFAGIAPDKALWVAVMEKAWTYFRPSSNSPGSYDGIQSGFPSESLMGFGSTDAAEVNSNNYNTAPQLLTAMSAKLQAGDLVDVGTQQPPNWPASDPPLPSGLFIGHAYSVVGVDVANNQVHLRNPWATNTGGRLDGSNGDITITGDQLIQSISDYSYGSLPSVTPDPNPNPTPNPTPTPTPVPTTTTTTVQTLPEDLGPNSYQSAAGTHFDFFTFTANTDGQAEITINSTAFTPQLLIAQQGTNGWTSIGTDANATATATADVKFTVVTGVTYGIGIFVSGTTDNGAYTMTLNGDLSAPVQATPTPSVGSLSGVVFNDANADGTQNNGEAGLAGRTVFIDLNGSGQFADGDPIATTTANGTYTFTGLAPGTYSVLVQSANGYSQTTPAGNAGVAGTVIAGQNVNVGSFGEAQQGGGGITGTVYTDTNGNSVQDGGELGLAGWYVYIDLGNSGQFANGDPYATTDANGKYSFQGLAPGSYKTRIYPTSGFTTTEGSTGWVNTVTASQSSVGGNFGETQASGTVTGVVYVDTNGNGVQDAGELGLAGWQVYVDTGNTGSYVTGDPVANTDTNGTYTFTGLAAGTYIVRIIAQSGYTTNEGSLGWTATSVTGQSSDGGSFGESQATGSLSGTVYDDLNRDGTQDGYEAGITSWRVYIDLNNSGQYVDGDPVTNTDTNGAYSFTGLAQGTYIVRAYVYTGSRWSATEGVNGWAPVVAANQNSFGGNFGEHI